MADNIIGSFMITTVLATTAVFGFVLIAPEGQIASIIAQF